MIKKDIVKYLISMLDRETPELLILVITFLKKLSVFKENKDEMLTRADVLLTHLERLVASTHKTLQNLTMRLIMNLSHDILFRQQIIKHGILDKITGMFKNQNYTVVTLQLLYQLSIDDKHRQSPIFAECVPQLLRMILEYKGDRVNSEVIALAINLSTVPKYCNLIVEDNGIRFLIKRALKTRDPLLFKMLRSISAHPDTAVKCKFLDFIDDIMHLIVSSFEFPELLVELLGIVSNLNIHEFDFAKLAQTYDMMSFFISILSSASRQNEYNEEDVAEDDDILLEVVVLIGTMLIDENIPEMVIQTPLLQLLVDVMSGKFILNRSKRRGRRNHIAMLLLHISFLAA